MGALEHLKQFLRDPSVASLAPTSAIASEKICNALQYEKSRTLVEFGPADGVLTRRILARMPHNCRLVCIEMNDEFARQLKRSITDPRLTVIQGNAHHVSEILVRAGISQPVDGIVSGIPLSTFPEPAVKTLFERSFAALAIDR